MENKTALINDRLMNHTFTSFKIIKSTLIASEYIENKGDKDFLSLLKSLKKEQLHALILLNENFKNELEEITNENID